MGTLSAVVHGVALPLAMDYFGLLTNSFINQFTSKQLANFEFRFDPFDFLSLPKFSIINPEIILSGFINFTNLTGGIVNCSDDFILLPPVLTFERVLELGVTELADCLDDDGFILQVNRYVITFVGIAISVILFGTIQIVAFQVSADRQARTIKQRFFGAVLYQEAAWFDSKSGGELSGRFSK